jgi:hypothetical protein
MDTLRRICELTDADDMSCLARTCKLLRKLAEGHVEGLGRLGLVSHAADALGVAAPLCLEPAWV